MERKDVSDELDEKRRQLKAQYAGEMKSFWQDQKTEYIHFFRKCPKTCKYAGLFFAGLLIGKMIWG